MEYNRKIGIVAGNFDVMHPGYVQMFKEINNNCTDLYILLHDDPSLQNPEKLKPILSIQERRELLEQVCYFSYQNILSYNTEEELLFLIKSIDPDVRFLGDDYADKSYTGDELGIPIHWVERNHKWSTTLYKKLIAESCK
jgi:glycerol-3-phosphate cytidylyltransferase